MRDYTQPGKREDRQARRRELTAQKHAVHEQLAELRGRLPGLSRSAMQPQKSSVSKKRPSDTKWEASRDGKRQRLEQERSRRVNGIWQQCQTILKGIMKSVSVLISLTVVVCIALQYQEGQCGFSWHIHRLEQMQVNWPRSTELC